MFPGSQREVAAWSADQERHLADAGVPDHRAVGDGRVPEVMEPRSLVERIRAAIRRTADRFPGRPIAR